MSEAIIEVADKAQFDEIIANEEKLVIADFWAEWCGPCRMLGPVLHDLAETHADNVLLVKVDVDANQDLAMEHGVRSIPQVSFFKAGEQVDQFVGALPPDQVEKFIEKHTE